MVFSLLGAAIGLGSSLLGSASQATQQREAREDAAKLAAYQDQTNEMNWQFAKDTREFEFNESLRIFGKSKEIYERQLSYNNDAASRSYAAESRKVDEYLQELAFKKQDMFVELLGQRGKAEASGRTGRSAFRLANVPLAAFGRDNAALAEGLVSRYRQFGVDNENIGFQKQGADNDAWSRLGLEPVRGPEPPKPLKVPVASGGGGVNPLLMIGNAGLSAVTSGLNFGRAK